MLLIKQQFSDLQLFKNPASQAGALLTKYGPRRNGLTVEPKRNLRQDHGHEAGHVGLDDKVADFPLQVKVGHHHRVLTCSKQAAEENESKCVSVCFSTLIRPTFK